MYGPIVEYSHFSLHLERTQGGLGGYISLHGNYLIIFFSFLGTIPVIAHTIYV